MNRQSARLQPPSPPTSNNGDVGLGGNFAAQFDPYTPPRSTGHVPHEQYYGPIGQMSSYAVLSPPTQQPIYYSPQPTFARSINDFPTPISTDNVTTRGRREAESREAKTPERSVKRSKKRRTVSKRSQTPNDLPGPLSEITKNYATPVRDMAVWVNRPVHERLREVTLKHGHVARPMNSFMLYRSAYAERVKQYCRENNHQIVSKVTGQSWPMEPKEIRDLYTQLASVEKENHQAAHPEYKFSPNKVGNKRAREREEESDSDAEWGPPRRFKRSRPSKRQEQRDASTTPFEPDSGRFTMMYPVTRPHPSSYQAVNTPRSHFTTPDPGALHDGLYHTEAVSYFSGTDEARYSHLEPNGPIFEVENGVTGMPDGSDGLLGHPEYQPVYPMAPAEYGDPILDQPDGNYMYEHQRLDHGSYAIPRSARYGGYPPLSVNFMPDPAHPGFGTLAGSSSHWYDDQETGSDFDQEFRRY